MFNINDQKALAKLVTEMYKSSNYHEGDFVEVNDGLEMIVQIDDTGTIFTREVKEEGNMYSAAELSEESGQDASNLGECDIVDGYDGEEVIVSIIDDDGEGDIYYTKVLGEGGNQYTEQQLDTAKRRQQQRDAQQYGFRKTQI